MEKVNYKWYSDGDVSWGIEETYDEVNNVDTFSTFSEAKKSLIEQAKRTVANAKYMLSYVKKIKKNDLN